jgi:hypothetical protein
MNGILDGMMLYINSATWVVVQNPTATTFDVYWPIGSLPSGGQSIVSYQISVTMPTTFATISSSIDASFDGVADTGYDTADVVHLSVFIADVSQLADLRLRVFVNSSAVDYYEKSILPSSLQAQVSTSQTADTALVTRTDQVSRGIVGEFDILNETSNQAKAEELNLIASTAGNWSEITISKNLFLQVGKAGTGAYTWKNITGFQVYYVPAGAGSTTIAIGSLYIAGGFGPNGFSISQTVPLLPYDYLVTYRNPSTNQESSPCAPMIPENVVYPRRQSVVLTISGTDDPQIPTTTNSPSIAIYRRGGSFSDGLYRLIGYATNPGATRTGDILTPSTVQFYDNQSDASITSANLIEFDNDPPVVASLPIPLTLAWTGYASGTGAAGFTSAINYAWLSGPITSPPDDVSQVLKPGNRITVAIGTKSEEQAVVEGATNGSIYIFLQYDHTTGGPNPPVNGAVFVSADSVSGSPGNLACEAYDSIFVAGNAYNPQTLFQSKVGLPESFPVVELDTGIAKQIDIGGPSNPIMGVCEFNGQIVTLNLSSLYVVNVFGGQMQAPQQTAAQRGCVGTYAWCKADNEIWYMSYDGIYSWSGGQSYKRSQELDPLFKGQTIGNYAPVKLDLISGFSYTGAQVATFSFYKNQVMITYIDTNLQYNRMVYDTIFKRWRIEVIGEAISGTLAVTGQYVEEDTGRLLISKTVTSGGTTAYLYLDDIGTTDGWVNHSSGTSSDGKVISFAVSGNAFTGGEPSLQKQFSEFMIEVNNDSGTIAGAVYYDFSSTQDGTDAPSYNMPGSPLGRRRIPFSLQLGFSKEAYSMLTRFSGTSGTGATTTPITFYSTTYNFLPLEQQQSAIAYDWDDLGHPADKRLYEISLEYDVSTVGGGTVTLNMDTMTGIVGNQTINTAAQTFTLIPAAGTYTGPRRIRTTFPVSDSMIVKQVRIRPSPGPSYFKDWKYSFQFEKYPPDIVPFTEWSNYGYSYLKYAQQLVMDIDTGGVNCAVALYADGGFSPLQTFTINTTSITRTVILTLSPNLTGYMFRLVLNNGSGGKAQLFNHNIVFEKADPGEVHHTFDYDMLGWPYDKKLQELTIHYNTTNTSTAILADTITGIKGETINVAQLSFVLDGPGRSLQTFAIPDNNYVKMIRLYPQTDNTVFKEWKYEFKFEKMPPDITLFTEWSDFGYPCEKIARNLILELNTDGVACTVTLSADGAPQFSTPVNTLINDRNVVIPLPSNLIGRLWKLNFAPGSGGASQLFSWKLDYIREPCAVNYMDTYEQDLGAIGWKWIKQVWVSYVCPSTITMTIFNDNGGILLTPFYTATLPAQSLRNMSRFYLPAINSGILNKTKKVRVQMSSTSPFKLYADSGFEWYLIGEEQRRAYRFLPETPEMQLPVAQLNAAPGSMK